MKLIDIIKYSLKGLAQRQVRSWLTMLGIVIGIAAVVSLLMIGEGFNQEIEKQLSAFGSNTIFVAPIAESQSTATDCAEGLERLLLQASFSRRMPKGCEG